MGPSSDTGNPIMVQASDRIGFEHAITYNGRVKEWSGVPMMAGIASNINADQFGREGKVYEEVLRLAKYGYLTAAKTKGYRYGFTGGDRGTTRNPCRDAKNIVQGHCMFRRKQGLITEGTAYLLF